MANQEAIQKYQDELKTLKDTLTKYGDLFNADGNIDAEEQAQLDNMQAIIKKAEAKLLDMEKGNGKDASKEQFLKSIEAFKSRITKLQAEVQKFQKQ